MSDELPPSKFGAGYTSGGSAPPPYSAPAPPAQPAYPPPPPAYPPPPPAQQAPPPAYPPSGYPAPEYQQPPTQQPPMPMPMPMAAGNPLGALRSNKLLLHVLAGALGGIVGALFGEPAVGMDVSPSMRPVGTGLWFGIIASFIAVSLFLSDTWYQRRQIRPERALIAWLCGAAAGFVAGAFAQWVYQQDFGESLEFKNYVLRSICWGIAGAVVGILMSRTIPNLGLGRGAAAGFAGGCVGGLAFIVIAQNLPETLGRAFGLAMLGVALGLAMYIVEKLFRDATLLVIWGPSDSAQFSLGQQPVTIGGDVEDDVHVAGAPPHVISIVLNYGHIEQIDNYTGARTALNNGSQFQVGPVCLVIQARQ